MRAYQPELFIARSQHKQLKKVIAEAFRSGNRVAPFLSSEVRRAVFCDDKTLPVDRVVPHCQVSYRLDWAPATPYRTLVFPEDLHDPHRQISILSPIGTALLGLRKGDQMHVFLPESGFHKLYVEGVKQPR
ncbi:MAG TPA: GreA/GreB family elongation factor [Rhizomicrobium sp.]|nr:GreA/GreB family elongation factor [Rhizomicrobium sp.]